LTPENIRHNVQVEWALSEEAWLAGETLLPAGLFRRAITQYYYAAFHAVRATLLTRDVQPKTHSGTRSELHRRLVRAGHIDHTVARALGELQKNREDADYSGELQFVREDAEEARSAASDLRDALSSLLRSEGWR